MSALSCPGVLPDVAAGAVSGLVVVALLYALHAVVQLARSSGEPSAAVALYLSELSERNENEL